MIPKVSIIMNCYNGEAFISDAIKSVINQKYNNWELIIWDNLSFDKSEQIIKSFKDDRIKYFKTKKFTNLSEARNLAILKSKGEILTFLDVDDYWFENKLLIQVNYFIQNNYQLIYSNFIVKNEIYNKESIYSKKKLPQGNITQLLLNKYHVGLLTIMISKNIINEIYFDKTYTIIGDFDLVIKISQNFKIGSIQLPLATYRIHQNNDSIINLERQIKELEEWYINKSKDYNFKKFNLSEIKNKIIFMKSVNYYYKNNKIDMIRLLLKQKNITYFFKMILYIIFPKIIVERLKK